MLSCVYRGPTQCTTIQDANVMENTTPASEEVTSELGNELYVHETTGGKYQAG